MESDLKRIQRSNAMYLERNELRLKSIQSDLDRKELELKTLRWSLEGKTLELKHIESYLAERDKLFVESFCKGRRWLADLVADAETAIDEEPEQYLLDKANPAPKAAEIVRAIKDEKRGLRAKLKFLEYQLRSYEEYFPFLEEYKEAILDESIALSAGSDNVEAIEFSDPVQRFLSKQEYGKLPSSEKNQLALDRYLARPKKNWEIGRIYERYLGYLYEQQGWRVTYEGAIKGFEDFGRDLICTKDDRILIVQAKYWSKNKVVREKHVLQLYGTACLYKMQNKDHKISAVLCITTDPSEEAKFAASHLKVKIRVLAHTDDYPMIKCNVNPTTKEKIYHLPFDQQYDRTVIGNQPGECYVKTTREAEDLGFRRAWKFNPHTRVTDQ